MTLSIETVPDHRVAVAVDQDVRVVAEPAAVAVAVADRHHSDRGLALGSPAAPVANAFARVQALDVSHVAADPHRRLEPGLGRIPAERIEPVYGDAAADHVEVRGGRPQGRGAVRRVQLQAVVARGPGRQARGSARAARRRSSSRARRRSRNGSRAPPARPGRRRRRARAAARPGPGRVRRAGPCRCRT